MEIAHEPPAGRWALESRGRLVHALGLVAALAAGFPLLLGISSALGLEPRQLMAGDATSFKVLACFSAYRVGLVTVVGLYLAGRLKPQELGWTSDQPGLSLGLGAAGGVLAIAVTVGMALAFGGADLHAVASAVFGHGAEQRLLFVMIGLDAAFTEESLFRGYLQPALVKRLGFGAGLLATAAVFAVYHLSFTPLGLLSKLVLGAVFGLLRGRDRPLWVSAIAHAMLWVVVGTL